MDHDIERFILNKLGELLRTTTPSDLKSRSHVCDDVIEGEFLEVPPDTKGLPEVVGEVLA